MRRSLSDVSLVIVLCFALSGLGATPVKAAPPPVARYSGTYSCIQGQTRVMLSVLGTLQNGLRQAEFAFGPTADNPTVPRGMFLMEGRIDLEGGLVFLGPTFWVDQPRGYNMVGLIGTVGPGGHAIAGKVTDGTGCTTFEMERDE